MTKTGGSELTWQKFGFDPSCQTSDNPGRHLLYLIVLSVTILLVPWPNLVYTSALDHLQLSGGLISANTRSQSLSVLSNSRVSRTSHALPHDDVSQLPFGLFLDLNVSCLEVCLLLALTGLLDLSENFWLTTDPSERHKTRKRKKNHSPQLQ